MPQAAARAQFVCPIHTLTMNVSMTAPTAMPIATMREACISGMPSHFMLAASIGPLTLYLGFFIVCAGPHARRSARKYRDKSRVQLLQRRPKPAGCPTTATRLLALDLSARRVPRTPAEWQILRAWSVRSECGRPPYKKALDQPSAFPCSAHTSEAKAERDSLILSASATLAHFVGDAHAYA